MYTAIQVADEILSLAKQQGRKLTPLQLMKLVYIAHGWHLAIRNTDLFPDRIEAWKYGPVIPELYHATKHFGRDPIPFDLIRDGSSGIDKQTSVFLRSVVEKYGHMSGYALSSLTHQSDTPWHQCYREGEFGIEIPDEIIKRHYTDLLNDRR